MLIIRSGSPILVTGPLLPLFHFALQFPFFLQYTAVTVHWTYLALDIGMPQSLHTLWSEQQH